VTSGWGTPGLPDGQPGVGAADVSCQDAHAGTIPGCPDRRNRILAAAAQGVPGVPGAPAQRPRSACSGGRNKASRGPVRNGIGSRGDWWGDINMAIKEDTFEINKRRALDYLKPATSSTCIDGFAGWDEKYRIKVRIICTNAYHALFMHNMLIRPTPEQLADFGEPDYVIFNAGQMPANPLTQGIGSRPAST
jgi:ATP-dependent phosphoenolpyruvate carboxykinase